MATGALAQAILGFVAIVCVGALLRATGLVAREDARPLNTVIIYVGLPAFVFQAVHGARISAAMLGAVAIAWVVFAVLLVASLIAARLLRLEPRRTGGFVLAASLGNTGYIGYPLTAALLGAAALPIAVFYDVFGTVLQLVLVGFPLARRFGGGARLSVVRLARELATFPALVAALLALALGAVEVPVPVSDWLDLLARMVAPLIMLSVGISLRPKAIAHGAVALTVLAGLRLVVGPMVAAMVGGALISDPEVFRTALLQAGMPSMMLTLAVGERFGLDDDFIAAAVFVTTAASTLTIPLVQLLVR
jgi:hypothetical protein